MKKYKLKEWIINQSNETIARNELAGAMGISTKRLSHLANADWGSNTNMKTIHMLRACEFMNISLDDLISKPEGFKVSLAA